MDTKTVKWLEQCYEDTVLLPLRSRVWKNEFEIALNFYSFARCRESAVTFLNSLQPAIACDADKSEKLRKQGNMLYKNIETLPEAVVLYTRAIYKAPNDSRLLAEAHANRAAALYKLEEYEAAYEDCVCALDFNHPEIRIIHLRLATIALKLCDSHKLEECIKRFEKTKMNGNTVFHQIQKMFTEIKPKPTSVKESPKPKGKKIKILYSKERGRYVVADEYIEANEIIMPNEPGVLALLSDKYQRRFLDTYDNNLTFICDSCYEQDIIPFPCYQCRSVLYCSRKCRREHASIHQYECNGLKLDLRNGMEIAMKSLFTIFDSLLIKLKQANGSKVFDDEANLWSALLQAGKEDELIGLFMNFDHFQSTQSCFSSGLLATLTCCYLRYYSDFFKTRRQTCLTLMRSESKWQIVVTALLLRIYIQTFFTSCLSTTLLTVKPFAEHSIKANGLSKTLQLSAFGEITCPRVALINHSCDPSCSLLMDKATLTVISQRRIRKGEEITICYSFNDSRTPASRKKDLWEHFGFICTCSRCKSQQDLCHMESNRVWCTCGNALVLDHDFSDRQSCPSCCRTLEVGSLVTDVLTTSLISDSVGKYYYLYDLYKRIEKLAPKTSSNIWNLVGTQILLSYLQSENEEIYRDEKLLCMLTYVATDLFKVLEEEKRLPVSMRIHSSMALLDLIVIRKKNGFSRAELEYDLNNVKQTFWAFRGKARKWLDGYFNLCVAIQAS